MNERHAAAALYQYAREFDMQGYERIADALHSLAYELEMEADADDERETVDSDRDYNPPCAVCRGEGCPRCNGTEWES